MKNENNQLVSIVETDTGTSVEPARLSGSRELNLLRQAKSANSEATPGRRSGEGEYAHELSCDPAQAEPHDIEFYLPITH